MLGLLLGPQIERTFWVNALATLSETETALDRVPCPVQAWFQARGRQPWACAQAPGAKLGR